MAYAFSTFDPKRMARASVKDASVSFKKSVELSKRLRGMMSDKAERYLGQVIELKAAVPFTRYMNGAGHRRGDMMAGKYPVKAAQQFLQLLKQGVANAENAGLGTPLKIVHVMAQPAATPRHAGRKRGLTMKRAHLELVLVETEESKRREKKQKKAKKTPETVAEKSATKVDEKKTDEKKAVEKKVETVKTDVPEKKEVKKPTAKKIPAEKKELKAKPMKKSNNPTE